MSHLSPERFDCWDHPDPFIHAVQILDEDIDSYAHVNNSVYVRWIDDCARAHSDAVGIIVDEAMELGVGMAVKHCRVEFFASAYRQDQVFVGDWIISNDGKLRVTRRFQIVRANDQATLVRAEVDYICINIRSGRASRMPALFREKYEVVV